MRALKGGDRLPSTREIAEEMRTNPRVVLAAYKTLADEGLVEIRKRSGNYVAPRNMITDVLPPPPTLVVVDILADAIQRGYSAREFSSYVADAAYGSRLRAVIVTGTSDQEEGIARELRDDLSISSSFVSPHLLKKGIEIPSLLRKADLIVTTEAFRDAVTSVAQKHSIPFVVTTVRKDIINAEWVALIARGVSVIAADRNFLTLLRAHLSSSPEANSIKMLVAGEDSLDSIGIGDATYVTAAARKKLGFTRIPGTLVSPPRFLSDACLRAILKIAVSLRFDREAHCAL